MSCPVGDAQKTVVSFGKLKRNIAIGFYIIKAKRDCYGENGEKTISAIKSMFNHSATSFQTFFFCLSLTECFNRHKAHRNSQDGRPVHRAHIYEHHAGWPGRLHD